MRKKHIKTISMLISLAISEITSIQVNAQTWNGNGYYFSRNLDDIKSDDEINESNKQNRPEIAFISNDILVIESYLPKIIK